MSSYAIAPGVLTDDADPLATFLHRVTSHGHATGSDITVVAPASWRGPGYGDGAWWMGETNGIRTRVAWSDRIDTDPLLGGFASLAQQTERLDMWRRVVGTPYYGSPGVAATMNLRSRKGMQGVQWKIRESGVLSGWLPPGQINDLTWKLPAKKTVRLASACRWDLRSAYLAALSLCPLPATKLMPTGANPILPTDGGSGYYRVRVAKTDPWRAWLGPSDRHGCHWLGASTYQVMGCPPVLDSYTAPARRILRGWAEHWRDLMTACHTEPYRSTLKDGYTQMVGLFAVQSGSIYRPDWRHMIMDYTRASMLRRIRNVSNHFKGLLPSCVDTDSVWYHHPAGLYHHTLAVSLGEGPLIGQFRSEGQPCQIA